MYLWLTARRRSPQYQKATAVRPEMNGLRYGVSALPNPGAADAMGVNPWSASLHVVAAPLVIIGMLQLSGCAEKPIPPPPPGGVYRSESAGAHFDQSVKIKDQPGEYIALFPLQRGVRPAHSPNTVHVAAGARGVIKSTDGGETWEVLGVPLASTLDVVALANGVVVVAGIDGQGQGYILRTIDSAKSWEIVLTIPVSVETGGFAFIRQPAPPASRVVTIALDPFDPTRLYAGTNLGTVLAGEQSAKTWRTLYTLPERNFDATRAGLGVRRIVPSPHTAGEVAVVTQNDLLYLASAAEIRELKVPKNLTEAPSDFSVGGHKDVFDVSYIADFPNALFVGVEDGAVISRNRGSTWEQLPLPLGAAQQFNTAVVAASPTNSNRLLIAINSVTYRSEDGGRSWNTFPLGLANHGITAILINPANASQVLLVTTPLTS